MDKLTLAHEYFLARVSNPSVTLRGGDLENIMCNAWIYANAMIAEDEKRVKSQEEADVQQSKEWQPDWSEAPDWANYWSIDFGGHCGRWYSEEPKKDVVYYQGKVNSLEQDSSTFGYIGLWQESLRKRPE